MEALTLLALIGSVLAFVLGLGYLRAPAQKPRALLFLGLSAPLLVTAGTELAYMLLTEGESMLAISAPSVLAIGYASMLVLWGLGITAIRDDTGDDESEST